MLSILHHQRFFPSRPRGSASAREPQERLWKRPPHSLFLRQGSDFPSGTTASTAWAAGALRERAMLSSPSPRLSGVRSLPSAYPSLTTRPLSHRLLEEPPERPGAHFILSAIVMALFFKHTDRVLSYPKPKTFTMPQSVKIPGRASQALPLPVLICCPTNGSLFGCKFQQPGIIILLHTMYIHVSRPLFTAFPFA